MGRFETILLIIVGFFVIFMLCLMFLPVAIYADEIHGHLCLGYLAEGGDYSADLQISYTFWIVTLQGGSRGSHGEEPRINPIFLLVQRHVLFRSYPQAGEIPEFCILP